MMNVEQYVLGAFATNTYLLSEKDEAIIIDPAGKEEKMLEIVGDRKVLAILLTHGHFDHLKGVDGLYNKYHCPVYIHEDDEMMARDKYSGKQFGIFNHISCPVEYFKEGKMKIGPFDFEVIFTPGHTPGSVIFVFDDFIFTGDTLFKGSIGRTDLVGGDERRIRQSLQIFKNFNKDYLIYPGHDDISKLSYELMFNPFL